MLLGLCRPMQYIYMGAMAARSSASHLSSDDQVVKFFVYTRTQRIQRGVYSG